MILVSCGFAPREVAAWAIPKMKLWLPLAEEQKAREALMIGVAMNDPKALQAFVESRGSRVEGSEQSETPTSQAEFEKLVSDGNQS